MKIELDAGVEGVPPGMLNAERSFRRLKGYRQMPTLVAALAHCLEAVTPACDAARVA
jgi:hypothetical protein